MALPVAGNMRYATSVRSRYRDRVLKSNRYDPAEAFVDSCGPHCGRIASRRLSFTGELRKLSDPFARNAWSETRRQPMGTSKFATCFAGRAGPPGMKRSEGRYSGHDTTMVHYVTCDLALNPGRAIQRPPRGLPATCRHGAEVHRSRFRSAGRPRS